jgi:hypothetical protein
LLRLERPPHASEGSTSLAPLLNDHAASLRGGRLQIPAVDVFAKRDAFQKAFRGFDVATVATMTARDVADWCRTPRSSETGPRSRRPSTTPAR